jgi:hypothetical protein
MDKIIIFMIGYFFGGFFFWYWNEDIQKISDAKIECEQLLPRDQNCKVVITAVPESE